MNKYGIEFVKRMKAWRDLSKKKVAAAALDRDTATQMLYLGTLHCDHLLPDKSTAVENHKCKICDRYIK